jgi:hypothetical protein
MHLCWVIFHANICRTGFDVDAFLDDRWRYNGTSILSLTVYKGLVFLETLVYASGDKLIPVLNFKRSRVPRCCLTTGCTVGVMLVVGIVAFNLKFLRDLLSELVKSKSHYKQYIVALKKIEKLHCALWIPNSPPSLRLLRNNQTSTLYQLSCISTPGGREKPT